MLLYYVLIIEINIYNNCGVKKIIENMFFLYRINLPPPPPPPLQTQKNMYK